MRPRLSAVRAVGHGVSFIEFLMPRINAVETETMATLRLTPDGLLPQLSAADRALGLLGPPGDGSFFYVQPCDIFGLQGGAYQGFNGGMRAAAGHPRQLFDNASGPGPVVGVEPPARIVQSPEPSSPRSVEGTTHIGPREADMLEHLPDLSYKPVLF